MAAASLASRYSGTVGAIRSWDWPRQWDFAAPGIPNEPRDVSAAAIALSGLLELEEYATDVERRARYAAAAQRIMAALTAPPYLADPARTQAILLHGVGSRPAGTEVDVSLVYADYYFVEALLRYQRARAGGRATARGVDRSALDDGAQHAVLAHLNLDHPGLETVRARHLAGDHRGAHEALLSYYRTRTNRSFADLGATAASRRRRCNCRW